VQKSSIEKSQSLKAPSVALSMVPPTQKSAPTSAGTAKKQNLSASVVKVSSQHSSSSDTVSETAFSQCCAKLQEFVNVSTKQYSSLSGDSADTALPMTSNLDDQLALLNLHDNTGTADEEAAVDDIKNAVLFPAKLLDHYEKSILPQYGLLGSCETKEVLNRATDPRIFLNTNIPFSAFICGVQGSGKSHTTSCLIGRCFAYAFKPLVGSSDVFYRRLPYPLSNARSSPKAPLGLGLSLRRSHFPPQLQAKRSRLPCLSEPGFPEPPKGVKSQALSLTFQLSDTQTHV